ncbi:hypothetical protein [Moorena sp. SIO3I6]|uniref:hypothetical protein n=1 Tax=Moorena sp. SIO3I6 TaxID=2607831 RepID=UPI0013F9176E|nr:hypothetical protein [Moorena sp. SIO3I6]NEP27196.1 hypothetical protein [Moorena sp. SIO3I6]
MSGDRKINTEGGNYNEKIYGNYVQGNYYPAGQNQTLAEAAAEIQQLLEQLDKSYTTNTITGQMELATEVIKRIETNPPLMNRVLSALKAGSIQALAQALNHPVASFVIAAMENLQKTQGK